MPILAKQVDTPTTEPAPYGLLETITPKPMPDHGGLAGLTYDTEFCGVARPWRAPCLTDPAGGTVSVSVDITALATISASGTPEGDYLINWGDGSALDPAIDSPDAVSHQYAAAGDYEVTVNGPNGWRAVGTVTVTDGVATGPFDLTVESTKVGDDGIAQTVGQPIPVYHLFTCRLIGSDDREARAVRALDLGAPRAVEEGFGQIIGDEAVDLSPGVPVPAVRALALLEQYGGRNYGGRRVIHASLDVVTLLGSLGLIKEKDGDLRTLLGSLVIAGPGYGGVQSPAAPTAGAQWMFATGAVNVWVSDTEQTETVLNSNPYDNEFNVLAERTYVPTFECFAAAVEVNLEA